jgi:hypothetical protein
MANGNGLLSIKLSKEQWERMSPAEKEEHTFYCLCYLVGEAQKDKLSERLLTFAGSFVASLVALIPTIWIILQIVQSNGR